MAILSVDSVFSGVIPAQFARNGLLANGPFARAIARAVNHLIAMNGQIVPGKSVAPSSARNSATDARLWVTRYRAGANGTKLVVEVNCIPTDTTTGTPYWYLKIDGASASDVNGVTNQVHGVRSASGAGTDLADIFVMRREYTVTAGAKHTVEIWTKDKCRIVGWFLHEKPRVTLTTGTDTLADYQRLVTLSRIYDVDVNSLVVAATSVYQKLQSMMTSWYVDDPASPIAVSSTSATKLYESAGTVGSFCPTQYRNRYADDFAATLQIPCYAWAYMERTGGAGNVLVRLKGANHGSGVDISCNSTLNIYESTSFTLKPQAAGDTMVPEYLVSAGGTTGNLYGLGLLPLIGT